MILLTNFFQDIFASADSLRLLDFFSRLFLNTASLFILIRFIYYKYNSRLESLFTFFLMGTTVFLIASALDSVKLDFGFAFGLFAIFSIIRFRTPPVDMKEMTYLFVVIGLSVINSLVEFKVSDWFGLTVSNLIVFGAAYFMENYKPKKMVLKKMLVFNPTSLAVLDSRKLLIEEVRKETNLDIIKVEIEKIHAVKGEVSVWVYFRLSE